MKEELRTYFRAFSWRRPRPRPAPRPRSCPTVSRVNKVAREGKAVCSSSSTCLQMNVFLTRMDKMMGSMNMPRRPGTIHCVKVSDT